VGGVIRNIDGRRSVTTASSKAWPSVIGKVRNGTANAVYLSAVSVNGAGQSWPPHTAAGLGVRLHLTDTLDDDGGQDLPRDLMPPPAPWLAVEMDLEFAPVVPIDAFVELLAGLVDLVPVTSAYVHVGRFPAGPAPWLKVLPIAADYDRAAYPIAEARDSFRWLRTSADAPRS